MVLDIGGYAGVAWAVLGAAVLAIVLSVIAPSTPFRWPNLRTIFALTLLCAVDMLAAACALAAPGCTPWGQYWRNHMKVGPTYLRPVGPVAH